MNVGKSMSKIQIISRFQRMIICSNLPSKIRAKFASACGIAKNASTRFGKNIFIEAPHKVQIGKNCLINNGVHIYTGFCNDSQVIIGDNVAIGLDTCITTNSHMIGNSNQRWGENTSKSVTIEDGTWIGADVTVLQGVTIGRGGVIAAGAVVTSSTEPDALYAGVLARKIKSLSCEQ